MNNTKNKYNSNKYNKGISKQFFPYIQCLPQEHRYASYKRICEGKEIICPRCHDFICCAGETQCEMCNVGDTLAQDNLNRLNAQAAAYDEMAACAENMNTGCDLYSRY